MNVSFVVITFLIFMIFGHVILFYSVLEYNFIQQIISFNFFYRYEETILKVGRKKTNIMFIGDGKGKTVISTGKSVQDNMTTFHTAGFGKISRPPYFFTVLGLF